jgi:hypothetical protein
MLECESASFMLDEDMRTPYMVQEGSQLCWGWHITICKVPASSCFPLFLV